MEMPKLQETRPRRTISRLASSNSSRRSFAASIVGNLKAGLVYFSTPKVNTVVDFIVCPGSSRVDEKLGSLGESG